MDARQQISRGGLGPKTVYEVEGLLEFPPLQGAGRATEKMVGQGVQLFAGKGVVGEIGEQGVDFSALHRRTVYM